MKQRFFTCKFLNDQSSVIFFLVIIEQNSTESEKTEISKVDL